MIEFVVVAFWGVGMYIIGVLSVAPAAAKKLIEREENLRRENHVIPKEENCKSVKLHDVQWYQILKALQRNGDVPLYSSLYFQFTKEEIEDIEATCISQDMINRINRNEIL